MPVLVGRDNGKGELRDPVILIWKVKSLEAFSYYHLSFRFAGILFPIYLSDTDLFLWKLVNIFPSSLDTEFIETRYYWLKINT